MFRVLVTDNVAPEGVAVLNREPDIAADVRDKLPPEELLSIIPAYDALIVRSATRVTAEVLARGERLKVVGRAGVGVDNIDVAEATRRGIIVVNAPGGNTIAATEHTLALMLALARNVPQAHARLKSGVWDKKSFVGVELRNKVLGILGLGRIGGAVAKRAQAFEMTVLAYDPYITEERARELGVELCPLEEVLRRADFLSIHMPLTKETHHLLDARAFALMKDGVRLVNCARGGIVDEEALYEALKAGKVGGAALDVFEKEPLTDSPLFALPNVIVTPHLGASTREAQVSVAVDVAQEIVAALRGELVRNAVNIPALKPDILAAVRPYLDLAERLGRFLGQLSEGRMVAVDLVYSGELAALEVGPLTLAFLKGLLNVFLQEQVNYVNARLLAQERGIAVHETRSYRDEDYTNLITAKVTTDRGEHTLAGTLLQGGESRVVMLDGYRIDTAPVGHMLVIPHIDRPRIIGRIGTLIGNDDVNIAAMQVGRKEIGGRAVMVLAVDSPVPDGTLAEIAKGDGILGVKMVSL
ncbi:MAG: phosphoglycerate dehydrogenase [Bacillota bacterium]